MPPTVAHWSPTRGNVAGNAFGAAHLPGQFAPTADLFEFGFPGHATDRDYSSSAVAPRASRDQPWVDWGATHTLTSFRFDALKADRSESHRALQYPCVDATSGEVNRPGANPWADRGCARR